MVSDDLRVSVLVSSSSGNVTYIETPKHHVLVDAGMSGKKIKESLDSIGKDINDIDSLFVTHEHSDHVQGVGVLARRYDLNVYANQKTWDAMASKIGKVPDEKKNIFEHNKIMTLDDLDIQSFAVSHDAADPQFYKFYHNGKTFVILTDTGYVSEKVQKTIENADAYLMECNHDVEMLRNGMYPWPLKQRILSEKGHLSNDDGARTLMDVIGNKTKEIYLGHLSPENNTKTVARTSVTDILEQHDFGVGHDFKIMDTDPKVADPLITL
ncbi:MBL fold metallo-hydrolase [Companilactobacillus allii]|uniref:MBL fold metallo-hydrolase n=1 Tax=Companilactobacillus allii TaxID=1847728 RepID=UPI0009FB361D|nr:MBL fold metallo-hydrolase [Companilactobacillus allii]USQ69915.1 MBL fold metallo-hydrolase [Companilactobacillus allii]